MSAPESYRLLRAETVRNLALLPERDALGAIAAASTVRASVHPASGRIWNMMADAAFQGGNPSSFVCVANVTGVAKELLATVVAILTDPAMAVSRSRLLDGNLAITVNAGEVACVDADSLAHAVGSLPRRSWRDKSALESRNSKGAIVARIVRAR